MITAKEYPVNLILLIISVETIVNSLVAAVFIFLWLWSSINTFISDNNYSYDVANTEIITLVIYFIVEM